MKNKRKLQTAMSKLFSYNSYELTRKESVLKFYYRIVLERDDRNTPVKEIF